MYKVEWEVYFFECGRWQALRDFEGRKMIFDNPLVAKEVAKKLEDQTGILDTIVMKKETTQVHDIFTRQQFPVIVYTGIVNAV